MAHEVKERILTRRYLIVLAGAFGVFFANGVVTPVLPLFVKGPLGGGDVAVGVTFAITAVSAIGIRPWITPKFNTWGYKPILVGSFAAAAASFALTGYMPNVASLIALRLILGAAMACIFIGSLTAVTSWVASDRAGEAVSLFSVAPYISMGLGPFLGQWIFREHGYTITFLAAGVIACLGIIPMLFLQADKPEIIDDGVPLKRFYPGAVMPGVVIAFGIVGMLAFGAFIPLFAPEIQGMQVQYAFLILSVVVLLFRTLGSKLPDKWGPKRTGTVATTGLIIGLAALSVTPSAWAWWAYLSIVPFAMGMALQYPGLLSLTLEHVDDRDRPVAISTFTMLFDISNGLSGLFIGVVAAVGGYRSVFAASAFMAFIGLLLLLMVVVPRYEALKKTPFTRVVK
jgi:MFS family permease